MSLLLQPPQGRIKNLNTLSLYIMKSYDMFARGEVYGRVEHLPIIPIGAGTTFSALRLFVPGKGLRVLKTVRLRPDRTAVLFLLPLRFWVPRLLKFQTL